MKWIFVRGNGLSHVNTVRTMCTCDAKEHFHHKVIRMLDQSNGVHSCTPTSIFAKWPGRHDIAPQFYLPCCSLFGQVRSSQLRHIIVLFKVRVTLRYDNWILWAPWISKGLLIVTQRCRFWKTIILSNA